MNSLSSNNQNNTIYDCTLLHLPQVKNSNGNITAINNNIELPMAIERVYYLYDIPSGKNRAGHGHKECTQVMVAASGSFEVLLDDGKNKRVVHLNRPDKALYVPPYIWASLLNFSGGAIAMVLADIAYKPEEYLKSYDEFLKYKLA
jgi:oxalate decarboxylase/phosphoglucose isomerase-like protein (cupin superfamily)